MHHLPATDVQLSSLPLLTGESCPENGRSPGSVSTQHSSPRSDFTFGTSTAQPPNTCMGKNPASADGTSAPNTQPSDVIINRKESEGFGFVIISSLNRPETAAANSESSDCFSGVYGVKYMLMHSRPSSDLHNDCFKC